MFFGAVLKQGQPYTFDESEIVKGDVLNLSNAVLASGNKVPTFLYAGRTLHQGGRTGVPCCFPSSEPSSRDPRYPPEHPR
jgi:hypothetical protein